MEQKKIGLSISNLQSAYGDSRALEIAAEVGADAVDFSTDSPKCDYRREDFVYKSDEELIEYYSKLKEKADSLGIKICQTHGRIRGFQNNKEEDDAFVENARLDCLAAHTLGAPVCVMHNVHITDTEPETMRNLNFDMYTRILPYAKQYGVIIATETLGDVPSRNICDFFGNINEFLMTYNRICAVDDFADYFKICIDTGHSNKAMRFGQPKPADVIRMCGKNIVALHLNDNDTLTDQHKVPMTGCIDWDDTLNSLDEIGYNGYYNMELNLKHFGKNFLCETADFAVKVMKNMLSDHYKK